MKLKIADTTLDGKTINEVNVTLKSERITLKDVIIARVGTEVDSYNQNLENRFLGLIQPTDSEKQLNGYKLKSKHKIDKEQQLYIALEAFLQNKYFVLINDKQVSDLEQVIEFKEKTIVNFIKLTPLIGG